MKSDVWKAVIRAIETSIPEYDKVNEKVSLGRALKAREYAVDQISISEGMTILDAGIGPGTMSEVLLSKSKGLTIVGLDASTTLLGAARERFRSSKEGQVHLVRATFEAVPVRDGGVNRIVSAYAFRDARDRGVAIDEFRRVLGKDGSFAIIDLGKPNEILKRTFVTLYIEFFMPLIARFSKSNRIRGNPWRMIVPTYRLLVTNRELVQSLRKRFAEVKIWEFSLGGIIIILARVSRLAPAS
jgi:demethylmenaquinone methyltransferase/2-methoxy-6-polyprenyl-1,4-benzoquinol methylase